MDHHTTLADWTAADIAHECAGVYARYERERREKYVRYFRDHPKLRGGHPMLARDLPAALPAGWGDLADLLPPEQRHRWVLSGKSSQALALGLLGPAARLDPSGAWLQELGGFYAADTPPTVRFEAELAPEVLDEHPRTTSIDLLAETRDFVLCAEAKWTETGMGTCSCLAPAKRTPTMGDCSQRVLDRPRYWEVAHDVLGLPRRDTDHPEQPCPLHPSYQAVRNVAAALALAGPRRTAVFALLYDRRNPYFAGHGWWPGWADMLTRTLQSAHRRLRFRAAAWQDLIGRLPLDNQVREWAAEKHDLGTDRCGELPR